MNPISRPKKGFQMKKLVILILLTSSSMALAGSCWEEANIKSKQDFTRIREFQENRPKMPADFSNQAEVESYQRANQEYRDKVKAMQEEAQAKSRQYSEECRTNSARNFDASQTQSKNCTTDKESQIKANWDQLAVFEKTRPTVPSQFKNKEEFEAYTKAMDEFKAKSRQLIDEIKAKNKALIEAKCN